jgi:tetratricopeptide (TPR) repeat protein
MTRALALSVLLVACAPARSQPTPAPHTVAVEAPPTVAPEPAPPPAASDGGEVPTGELEVLDPVRLPRSINLGRPREYMVAELEALEKLLEQTPPTAPDRPALTRRIAISYFELFLKLQNGTAEGIAITLSRSEKYFGYASSGLDSTSFYVYGLLREIRGDFSGAERAYQQALAQQSGLSDEVAARAHYGRALLAERRGQASVAQEQYKRAVDSLTTLGYERPEDRELRRKITERLARP